MFPPYGKVTATEHRFQFSRHLLKRKHPLLPRMTGRVWEAPAWVFVAFMHSLAETKIPLVISRGEFFCLPFACLRRVFIATMASHRGEYAEARQTPRSRGGKNVRPI